MRDERDPHGAGLVVDARSCSSLELCRFGQVGADSVEVVDTVARPDSMAGPQAIKMLVRAEQNGVSPEKAGWHRGAGLRGAFVAGSKWVERLDCRLPSSQWARHLGQSVGGGSELRTVKSGNPAASPGRSGLPPHNPTVVQRVSRSVGLGYVRWGEAQTRSLGRIDAPLPNRRYAPRPCKPALG
jgi:hypothetical protein